MRCNGTFNYKVAQGAVLDPKTGFYSGGPEQDWETGSECQIEKFIPAKQKIGVDGILYTYSYDLFIPKYIDCSKLTIGTRIQIVSEDGRKDEFTIQGIDDLNRKYIELWG